ncbi:MAG: acyl-CoA dehydrogenase family protein [Pseudomonadota bacterium]|nr:acyl-CoA dehydrogenase family protein [Pseudomonadota bacterium]
MNNETSQLLSDTAEKLFSDHVTKNCIEEAEKGVWPESLWSEVIDNGLNLILVPEDLGGVGGTWMNAGILFKASGRYQAPIPLAENIVASYVLSLGNIAAPEGAIITLLDGSFNSQNGLISGTSLRTPFSSSSSHGVVLFSDDKDLKVGLVEINKENIVENNNIALESRGEVVLENVQPLQSDIINCNSDFIYKIGALMRSNQMAGALESILDQSVRYANERIQFGRPIGKFQAIQQDLAVLSTHVAASSVAADYASFCMDKGDPDFAIAVAKSRIDDAVSVGAGIAHQVHGAIGFTYEHGLHFATRRLWSWRAEYGAGSEWAKTLGQKAISNGAEKFWPSITSGNLDL